MIFTVIDAWQQKNGLRLHDDHQRYRQYCSRRLRRLRGRHGRGKAVDELVLLLQVERAWSYGMQLRKESLTDVRKKHHARGRFRRAFRLSQGLATKDLSVYGYQFLLEGQYRFECEEWAAAATAFHNSRMVLLNLPTESVMQKRVDELAGLLRYAEYQASKGGHVPVREDDVVQAIVRSMDKMALEEEFEYVGIRVRPTHKLIHAALKDLKGQSGSESSNGPINDRQEAKRLARLELKQAQLADNPSRLANAQSQVLLFEIFKVLDTVQKLPKKKRAKGYDYRCLGRSIQQIYDRRPELEAHLSPLIVLCRAQAEALETGSSRAGEFKADDLAAPEARRRSPTAQQPKMKPPVLVKPTFYDLAYELVVGTDVLHYRDEHGGSEHGAGGAPNPLAGFFSRLFTTTAKN